MSEFKPGQLVVYTVPNELKDFVPSEYNTPIDGEVVRIESASKEFTNSFYLAGYTKSHTNCLQCFGSGLLRTLYLKDAEFMIKNLISKQVEYR